MKLMKSPYEAAYDSVIEIKCPHGDYFECWSWMDRDEFRAHLRLHPKENQIVECYWQNEADRRFEQGPYWTKYNAGNKYAA